MKTLNEPEAVELAWYRRIVDAHVVLPPRVLTDDRTAYLLRRIVAILGERRPHEND